MSYIAELGQEFGQYITQCTGQLLPSNQHPQSLSEMERQIREMLLKLGVSIGSLASLARRALSV